jgi:hypothetical protein
VHAVPAAACASAHKGVWSIHLASSLMLFRADGKNERVQEHHELSVQQASPLPTVGVTPTSATNGSNGHHTRQANACASWVGTHAVLHASAIVHLSRFAGYAALTMVVTWWSYYLFDWLHLLRTTTSL